MAGRSALSPDSARQTGGALRGTVDPEGQDRISEGVLHEMLENGTEWLLKEGSLGGSSTLRG